MNNGTYEFVGSLILLLMALYWYENWPSPEEKAYKIDTARTYPELHSATPWSEGCDAKH